MARWFPTKSAATTRREEQRRSVRHGEHVARTDMTVGEYLEEWLAAIRGTIRETTWESYALNARRYVAPALGGTPLQQLSAPRLNALYADLRAKGGRYGKGLSPRTVQLCHATIHRALRDGVRWRRVTRNVAIDADPPKNAPRRRSCRRHMI